MFLSLVALAAATTVQPGFDSAMAAKLCLKDAREGDLNEQLTCMERQLEGRRRFYLLAAHLGAAAEPVSQKCLAKWTEDQLVDWQMSASCLEEESAPLADAARLPGTFDAMAADRLCKTQETETTPGIQRLPKAPGECVQDQAIGYRSFALLKKAYQDKAIEAALSVCRARWESDGIPDWAMVESCAQDQVRAVERMSDFK